MLSPEDIDRMVNEAEKYAEEDKAAKQRVAEKLGGEFFIAKNDTIKQTCDDIFSWLESNQEADAEALSPYPIVEKVYKNTEDSGHAKDEL